MRDVQRHRLPRCSASASLQCIDGWLAADGRFTLDQRRAWLAMDCSSAVVRLQRWLKLKNRHIVYLKRMRLVHSRSITAAEAGWLEQKSVGCS